MTQSSVPPSKKASAGSPGGKPKAKKMRAGGRATEAGLSFQAEVGAWLAVQMLANTPIGQRFGLGHSEIVTTVRFETMKGVDDVIAGLSGGGKLALQCKTSLSVSAGEDSDFQKTVSQIVEEVVTTPGLDPTANALVIAVPLSASGALDTLGSAAQRVAAGGLSELATGSQDERDKFSALKIAIDRAYAAQAPTTTPAYQRIARILRVARFDRGASGAMRVDGAAQLGRTLYGGEANGSGPVTTLIDIVRDLIASGNPMSRNALLDEMRRRGARDVSAPDFDVDIAKLTDQTQETRARLDRFGTLPIGTYRLPRTVGPELLAAAVQGSFLMIGEPGAGKSGALGMLAERWAKTGPVVAFSVDAFSGLSGVRQLADELRLIHGVAEVLAAWPGNDPGLVIIDALDAARGGQAEAVFVRLIEQAAALAPRWRVVASVRTFDLLNGQRLRSLMPGPPASAQHTDPRAQRIRHFLVPALDSAERSAIATDVPSLASLLATGNEKLSALLGNIFNLSLAADLVEQGVPATSFEGIATQSDLIDRYEDRRIVEQSARSAMIAAISNMVEAGTLSLRAAELDHPGLTPLLASGVLSERDDRYSFAHHILFDHAAGRYYLDTYSGTKLTEQLKQLGSKAFMLSPALRFALERIWRRDKSAGHRDSWALFLTLIQERDLGPIAAASALRIAAEQVQRDEDLGGLRDAIAAADVEKMSRSLFQMARFLAMQVEADPPSAATMTAWAQLATFIIATGERLYLEPARFILLPLSTQTERLDPEGLAAFGKAAREALTLARNAGPQYRYARAVLIGFAALAWASDPLSSRAALSPLLDLDWLARFGHEDAAPLASSLRQIIPVDPAFAEHVFRAIHEAPEPDESKTDMGGSRILALSSTKRQDFNHSHYHLERAFRQLLKVAPAQAPAIFTIVSLGKGRREAVAKLPPLSITTPDGRPVEIIRDGLDLMDWRQRDKAVSGGDATIPDAFAAHVATVHHDDLIAIIEAAAAAPAAASVWRRLFGGQLAAARRGAADSLLWQIAAQPAVIESQDLGRDAIDYLRAVYPTISTPEREVFETALLNYRPDDKRRWRVMLTRLISALPATDIATRRLRRRRVDLARKDGLRGNPAYMSMAKGGGRLLRAGQPTNEPQSAEDRARRSIERALERYHKSKTPDALLALWRAVQRCRKAAVAAQTAGDDPASLFGAVAEAFASFVASGDLSPGTDRFPTHEELWAVLSELAKNPAPEGDEGALGYSNHAVRVYAAKAAMTMARRWLDALPGLPPLIERLVGDSNASVRHIATERLLWLSGKDQGFMWRLVDHVAATERHAGVLAFFTGHTLARLSDEYPERIEMVLETLERRVDLGKPEGRDALSQMIAQLVGAMAVDDASTRAMAIIDAWAVPPVQSDKLCNLLRNMRSSFFFSYLPDGDPRRAAGDRARRIARIATSAAAAQLAKAKAQLPLIDSTAPEAQPVVEQYVGADRVLDELVSQLYFGSGAYKESKATELGLQTHAQKLRFLDDWSDILEEVEGVATPHTIKYLLEIYEHLLDADPARLFERIFRFITGPAAREYYQHEQIAANDLVEFTRTLLADYRPLFDDGDQRDRLVAVLELFADAGWPEAMRLLWELPDLVR